MITAQLDRGEIVYLLRGTVPDFSVQEKIPEELGHFDGASICMDWVWSRNIYESHFSDEELYEFYKLCRGIF